MYDLHNHILSGIDDGPETIKESLLMARQAVAQGTTVMAATPHRFHGGNENIGMDIMRRVADLQAWFDSEKIPLSLVAGVEIGMRDDIVPQLKSGRLIPLGGPEGKAVLIEPPFDRIPENALDLLKSIQDAGYEPILAHPERNGEIQRGSDFVAKCVEIGVTIQITAGSVMGFFGPQALNSAREIAMHKDRPVIIASDAHWPFERTPGDLKKAMVTVGSWIEDQEAARIMVEDRPKGLVERS